VERARPRALHRIRRGRSPVRGNGLSRRLLIWAVVAIAAIAAFVYFRGADSSHPATTLTRAAVPVASRYAHDVLSRRTCAHAKTLADPATNDPCTVFGSLQGFAITGAARIVRGCDGITTKVTNIGRLTGKDCVAIGVTAPKKNGDLFVWLEPHDGRWRVAAAVSLVHRLG
jgi:hypothetical protein